MLDPLFISLHIPAGLVGLIAGIVAMLSRKGAWWHRRAGDAYLIAIATLAVTAAGLEYTLNPGEGAFYGPQLEFVLRDAIGRDWQCGTLQVDLNMPGRLGATFIGDDGHLFAAQQGRNLGPGLPRQTRPDPHLVGTRTQIDRHHIFHSLNTPGVAANTSRTLAAICSIDSSGAASTATSASA